MKEEIEVKFLALSHDTIRNKLSTIGAVCQSPMRLMRRAIIDYPDRRLQNGEHNAYIRVRDEGDKITLTFKQFQSLTVAGARELETIVQSFDDTVAIFVAAGLEVTSLQESKRETWTHSDCEIVLDEWPWLLPYIEIEGPTEAAIKHVAQILDLAWENAEFGDVMVAYRAQYPHLKDTETIGNVPTVAFDTEPPAFLQ